MAELKTTDMRKSWKIILQETRKEGSVEVKLIQRYPKYNEDLDRTTFPRLKHPFAQVIVDNGFGQLKFRLFPTMGRWTIVHPDREEYPTFKSKGRTVPDVLAEKKIVKGTTEAFDSRTEFRVRVEKFMDQKFLNYVIAALEEACEQLQGE